jgi:hypothetical protein
MLNSKNIIFLTLTSISSFALTVDRANAVAFNFNTGNTSANVSPYTFVGPSVVSPTPAFNTIPHFNYDLSNGPTSLWIGAQANASNTSVPTGTYTFSTTFDLTGLDVETTTFTTLPSNPANLKLASDNRFIGLNLNGTPISFTPFGPTSPTSFNKFTNYTIDQVAFKDALSSTTNELSFLVDNQVGPGLNPVSLNAEFGLNVEEVPYEFEAAAGFAVFGSYFVGKRYLKKKKAPLAK